MCHRHLVTVRRVAGYLGRADRRRAGRLRDRLALVDPRAESPMETHARLLLHRLNALREAGWLVLRFTADDVLRRPHDMARQVATAIRDRRTPCAAGRAVQVPEPWAPR